MAAQLLVQLVVLMLTKPWQRDPMKVWHKDQTKNCCCKSLLLSIYIDIKSRWRHYWKSAQVVNSHLVCDPTIRQPGFDLPLQQWSLLNRFRTEQGQCGACRRKWQLTDTDLCPCGSCGETQTMSHIVESCP